MFAHGAKELYCFTIYELSLPVIVKAPVISQSDQSPPNKAGEDACNTKSDPLYTIVVVIPVFISSADNVLFPMLFFMFLAQSPFTFIVLAHVLLFSGFIQTTIQST